MNKKDQKRLQKKKKRELKIAKNKDQERNESLYPKIIIKGASGVHYDFINVINDFCSNFDYGKSSDKSTEFSRYYKDYKKFGETKAMHILMDSLMNSPNFDKELIPFFCTAITEYLQIKLFQRFEEMHGGIPKFPEFMYDTSYGEDKNYITVNIKSLNKIKTKKGVLWAPSNKVVFNNNEMSIAYTTHFIDRMKERHNISVIDWQISRTIFNYIYKNVYFEHITFQIKEKTQSLFIGYNYLQPSNEGLFAGGDLLKDAHEFSDDFDDCLETYYIFGYFPYDIEGDQIIMKTILTPGMRGTPELDLIYKSDLDYHTKRDYCDSIQEFLPTARDLPEALKWCHNNGMKQIKQISRINDNIVKEISPSWNQ